MRTIHELLIILLKGLRKSKRNGIFEAGLCYEVAKLYCEGEFSRDEFRMLARYIEQCRPQNYFLEDETRYYSSDLFADGNNWSWLPGSFAPRARWLKEHIKLTANENL